MQVQNVDYIRELCRRATELRLADRPADALRAARQAHTAAATTYDAHTKAYAAHVLGLALLEEFYRGADLLFGEAMQRFDEAAETYQRLERIELYSVLLTMASAAMSISELDAAYSMLARIINDLADTKYATPDSLARHVDHLRGRAFLELGTIALHDQHHDEASTHFETAANLLIASREPSSIALLTELADTVEQQLGDTDAAAQIRAAAAHLAA
jgi:hypothetical protein